MPELTKAAEDFGRAFCVPADKAGVPLDLLPPEEAACVRQVGMGWESRVQERLGAGQSDPPTPDMFLRVQKGGQEVGQLTLVNGLVTLCLPAASCEALGHGVDALAAAESTLNHLGFQTEVVR
jgi:hypothetical protein